MQKTRTKKQNAVRLSVLYTFMAIAVVTIVTLLVFVMLGYRINRDDGKIEQGGLLQFASKPSGAVVTLDGIKQGFETPNKLTTNTGKHTVEMYKKGYQNWKKDVNLKASDILWLNYARLIPEKINTQNVAQYSEVSSTLASKDNKWYAVLESSAHPAIKMASIDNDKVEVKTLDLPAEIATKPSEDKTESFSLVKWDDDNRYILMRHVYDDDKHEWIVIDTKDMTKTKNITSLLGVQMDGVQFATSNNHMLYAIIDGGLRKINLDDATLSRPLVQNIVNYEQFDKATITFATHIDPESKKRSIGYFTDGAQKPIMIRSYADDGAAPLEFRIGKYFNDKYMAILYNQSLEIIKGDLPSSDVTSSTVYHPVATVAVPSGLNEMNFGANQRFIMLRSGANLTTYDLELQKTSTTTLAGYTNETATLKWLDGYNFWTDYGGTLRMYEFDGQNQRDIMQVVAGQDITLSPNGKYIYGISLDKESKPHLTRARINID